jgi:hypothetical protein
MNAAISRYFQGRESGLLHAYRSGAATEGEVQAAACLAAAASYTVARATPPRPPRSPVRNRLRARLVQRDTPLLTQVSLGYRFRLAG